MTDTVRVLLVDDHAVVRQGLKSVLESSPGIEVVGEAETAEESIRRAGFDDPDVVVMDVQLPDGTGVDATREILSAWPQMKVVILTSFADDEALHAAILAGASGYLLKRIRPAELVDGIRRAANGESLLDPELVELVFRRIRGEVPGDPLLDRLSAQELKVLRLIEAGKTNREIADELFLAEKTVKNYVSNMLSKLGMSRRTEAAAYAARQTARGAQAFPPSSWDDAAD